MISKISINGKQRKAIITFSLIDHDLEGGCHDLVRSFLHLHLQKLVEHLRAYQTLLRSVGATSKAGCKKIKKSSSGSGV